MYQKLRLSNKAFSLLEVLVSLVLITIVGTASWTATQTLSMTSEATNNRVIAEKIITKTQEELRRAASTKSGFDSLESHVFENITTSYPGFNRFINFIPQTISDFKKARIRVTFRERKVSKTLESIVMLAAPADGLPSNLFGNVYDSVNRTTIVGGVKLEIKDPVTGQVITTISSATPLMKNGVSYNYDFAEPGTNRYRIKSGVPLLLNTQKDNYVDKVNSPVAAIDSSIEQPMDIYIVPSPTATITARFSNLPPVALPIMLYENGEQKDSKNITSSVTFTVSFDKSTTKRCFTLATQEAYKARMVGDLSCKTDKRYHAEGWSSAFVNNDGSIDCSAGKDGWTGKDEAEDICVQPGETRGIDVPLVPVPVEIVRGTVLEKQTPPPHTPIQNTGMLSGDHIEMMVRWSNCSVTDISKCWRWNGLDLANPDGTYSIAIPVQDVIFFNEDTQGGTILYANYFYTKVACCNAPSLQVSGSAQKPVNFEMKEGGGPYIGKDHIIDTPDFYACGNISGKIVDTSGQNVTGSTTITLFRYTQDTPADAPSTDGNYAFKCTNASFYRVPVSKYNIRLTNDDYYPYDSTGNDFYTAKPWPIDLKNDKDDLKDVNFTLLHRGKANITGFVTYKQGTESIPVKNTVIKLTAYSGEKPFTAITDDKGKYTLNNIPETWPPPTLGSDYQGTIKTHTITVEGTKALHPYSDSKVNVEAGKDNILDIELKSKSKF